MHRPSKVDIAALQHAQRLQAEQVMVQDNFAEPQWIAGADVGFEQQGQIVRAVISVLHYPSLVMVEYRIARIPTPLPYIPGLLSFREYPGLLAAWRELVHRPQLVLVDGHGISHPRRLGIASHFGLLTGVATIGVAKQRLIGTMQPLSESFNTVVPLLENKQQLGWVWRSKERCHPLYISPGHHVSLNSALLWVQRCMKGYRLPEPIRWADAIASHRTCFQRYCFDVQ